MFRKILALVAAIGMIGASLPARAALCPKCRDRLLIESVGKCESCGAATASGALRLCPKCSAQQNRCELCGKSLDGWRSASDTSPSPAQPPAETAATGRSEDAPPQGGPSAAPLAETASPTVGKLGAEAPGGTPPIEKPPEGKSPPAPPAPPPPQPIDLRRPGNYNFGKWQYRLEIANAGTRGEGQWGSLWYAGQRLPHAGVNDYYRTPWGPVYWVDVPKTPWGMHGWMPVPLGQANRQGRALALPASFTPPTSPTSPPSPSSPSPGTSAGPAAPGKPGSTPNRQTLEVTRADSGKRARLYVGNALVVRLPGNPGTGYQWQLAPTSSPAVRLVAQPQFVASPVPAGVMGASGNYVFMLRAVQPGSGVVRLVYARPWEGDRTAADAFSLSVEVLRAPIPEPGRTASSPSGAAGGPQ